MRSLRETKEFLNELLSSEATPGVPDEIRRQAQRLLRHYPEEFQLQLLQRALPRQYGDRSKPPLPPKPSHALLMSDPEIMSGMVVFAGSRLPIVILLDCLDAGNPWEQIVQSWPFLTEAHVSAAREYVKMYPNTRSAMRFSC
jgi:uncharacterized protein (DUF433 family)